MCLTEYNEEVFVNGIRTESFNEGIERGKIESIVDLVQKGLLSIEVGANQLSCTIPEFEKLIEENETKLFTCNLNLSK